MAAGLGFRAKKYLLEAPSGQAGAGGEDSLLCDVGSELRK